VIGAARQLLFLALAGALSWWLFLSGAGTTVASEPRVERFDAPVLPVSVRPGVVAAEPATEPAEQASVVPPPSGAAGAKAEALERGAPEGAEDGVRPATANSRAEGTRSPSELGRDPELAAAARAELAGELRRGFDTVLLASPEEQLEIARAFGEELVLVPRRALDPDGAAHYFRLDLDGEPVVERVPERPPLGLRRYRDLFDYEYARLPEALRVLRRSVLARSDVYVFAALIPLSEWAVVVGRRSEALDSTGLEPADVRRFDLRYVRSAEGGFDLRVESIVLADGRVVRTDP